MELVCVVCVCVHSSRRRPLSAIKDSYRDTHLIEMNRFLDRRYRRRAVGSMEWQPEDFYSVHIPKTHTHTHTHTHAGSVAH